MATEYDKLFLRDSSNEEQFKKDRLKDIDELGSYQSENGVVCPYCGYFDTEIRNEGLTTCNSCQAEFYISNIENIMIYTSQRLEEEFGDPEDLDNDILRNKINHNNKKP